MEAGNIELMQLWPQFRCCKIDPDDKDWIDGVKYAPFGADGIRFQDTICHEQFQASDP